MTNDSLSMVHRPALAEATETDIEQAIADKTIARTWPMRGRCILWRLNATGHF